MIPDKILSHPTSTKARMNQPEGRGQRAELLECWFVVYSLILIGNEFLCKKNHPFLSYFFNEKKTLSCFILVFILISKPTYF